VNVPLTAFLAGAEDEEDFEGVDEDDADGDDAEGEGVADGDDSESALFCTAVLLCTVLLPRAETLPPERDLNESNRARPTAVSVRARRTLRIGG